MGNTLIERLTRTPEQKKRLIEEEAILEVSELLCREMEKENISRSQLAERLGTTKSNVTQILAGRRNMTIRLIADVLFALGKELRVEAVPLGAVRSTSTQSLTVWQVGRSEQTGYSPKTLSAETSEITKACPVGDADDLFQAA
ncbi:MAG: helix-turn-helix domain-containing protein [Phycisphaerae bacterium]